MTTKTRTKVWTIQFKDMKDDYLTSRVESSRLWNDVMTLHKYLRKRKWGWSSAFDFQKHFKKKGYKLHSQTQQAIISKFFSNLDTTRKNIKNGLKTRYPYKEKKHYNPIWKGQSIKLKGRYLVLPLKQGMKPLKIKISKSLASDISEGNLKVVQFELGYFEGYITLKEEIEINPIKSTSNNSIAAMDLGLIHTSFITNGKDTLALVGREMRSVNRQYNKQLSKLVKKPSKCDKYSNRWKKLQRRKKLLAKYRKNFMRNFHYHISITNCSLIIY